MILGKSSPEAGGPENRERNRDTMNGTEAIAYIHTFFRKGAEPGLHRIRELMNNLGNPQKNLKFIHVAGTNGKGSTVAMTASILKEAGYRTGMFTSPFLYRFQERMQVNGVDVADEDLARAVETVKPAADAMAEKPTEFEMVCAVAFTYFAQQKCDIVVLETGMGGAVDATNVIDTPEVAVITNIGLDHTEFLGDTLEKIAYAKAGIFKENGSAVVYRCSQSVENVYERVCADRNVALRKADFETLRCASHNLEGQTFDCGARKDLFLPLLGDHQLHNAAVALSVADTLIDQGWRISEEHIRQGLANVRWPGRFDIVGRKPLFIIDGGHNPQCIDALEKNIRDYLEGRRIIALTGVLADKDYVEMYAGVIPMIDTFVCITPPTPRRLAAEKLAEYLAAAGAKAVACDSTDAGVAKAVELAGEDGVVLCFGSLYSIGDIREGLRKVTGQ